MAALLLLDAVGLQALEFQWLPAGRLIHSLQGVLDISGQTWVTFGRCGLMKARVTKGSATLELTNWTGVVEDPLLRPQTASGSHPTNLWIQRTSTRATRRTTCRAPGRSPPPYF